MSNTRRYFGTDGIRGRVGTAPVTPELVLKLGWAVGQMIAREGGGKVLIGKDTRISGYMFESALEAGLSAAGVDIHLLGPMPTPAIAYLTRTLRAQAGIVISASHNPYYDNGIKFFSAQGSKLPDSFELALEDLLDKPLQTVDSARLGKAVRLVDAPGRYIEFCKSTVPSNTNFKDLRLVVDCAHGATYHVAPNVFKELGAHVIELNVSPNGFNINDNCGSTRPEVLQRIVRAERADLGIALDGDGDRVIMVDHLGELVDGDELLYIMAKQALASQGSIKGVVGTVMSNLGLERALATLNIPFIRSKVGDRYVMEALQQQSWTLGGEPSGHLLDLAATTTGDGIIASLKVLLAMQQTGLALHELKAGMHKLPQAMLNVKLPHGYKGQQLLEHAQVKAAIADAEHQLPTGRVLLRTSGTEPLIRVMAEAEDAQLVQCVTEHLAATIETIITQTPSGEVAHS